LRTHVQEAMKQHSFYLTGILNPALLFAQFQHLISPHLVRRTCI